MARAGDEPASGEAGPGLVFDGSSFECANLASAKLVSAHPAEYDLRIRPDTLNTRHRVWFYFSVRGARAGQKVVFNILGYSKTKSLFRVGMGPVVCSSGRPYWERMPPQSIYYYRSPRHNREYVLSFPFCFERADETYYFAYCFVRAACVPNSVSAAHLLFSPAIVVADAKNAHRLRTPMHAPHAGTHSPTVLLPVIHHLPPSCPRAQPYSYSYLQRFLCALEQVGARLGLGLG